VEDRNHPEVFTPQPVRNDVRRAGNHEFPRAGDSTGAAEIRPLCKTFNCIQDRAGDPTGGAGTLSRDVRTKVGQVADGAR
jgi:hypothetical protein